MDRDRWRALTDRLGCAEAAGRFTLLERAYAEKQRHYHTAQHIDECLALFDDLRELCDAPDEVEVAIWLHDVVYRPRRSDNEERSAEVATEWLGGCAREAALARLRRMILATRHAGEGEDPDERVLIDIDLHILGASGERFDEYEEQVRREYRWVPRAIFRKRRAQILEDFLARAPLYRTEACRERFEDAARENLRRSLRRLRG